MTHDQETIQLPMLIAAMTVCLTYNELAEAKQLNDTMMTWAKHPERRDEIYAAHRNAGDGRQGLESS